jgi:glutaminyl-tRNA synthetase
MLPFSREIYIEQEDFLEDAPRKFFRLSPGREVRLKHAYYITCDSVVKDEQSGEVLELHCTYDPATRGGWSEDGRKVKGTLHWVSAAHAVRAEVRLYDHLFTRENPADEKDGLSFKDFINPDSLTILSDCMLEPSLKEARPDTFYQFLRQGYFYLDQGDSTADLPVFNRTATLRDTWAKIKKKNK